MKVRFSLRFLLLGTLCVAVGLAWTIWPGRTFLAFKSAVGNERFEDATRMVRLGDGVTQSGESSACQFDLGPGGVVLRCGDWAVHRQEDPLRFVNRLAPEPPTWRQVLASRRVYAVPAGSPRFGRFEFVVERGTVTLRSR